MTKNSNNKSEIVGSAYGSAATKSTTVFEWKSSPKTPIQEKERSANEKGNGKNDNPTVAPQDQGVPINNFKNGSPIYVKPAMFANPMQGDFMFQPNNNWFHPNMVGNAPSNTFISSNDIPSQSSATANDDSNAGNLFNKPPTTPNTMLTRINDPSEFSAWIKNFIIFLGEKGLDQIVPDETGNPTNAATDDQKKFVLDIFKCFVSPKAYPKWFSSKLQENFIELFDVIEHALY